MLYYHIEHKENSVVITNLSIEVMKYTLNLNICGKDIKRAEGTIKPSSKVELKFLASDGEYNIVLLNDFVNHREVFSYYRNTLKMIIDNIEKICGTCGCNNSKSSNCKDSTDSCNILLQPLVMSLSYYFIKPYKYNRLLDYLSSVLQCNILEMLSCIIDTNYIIGKSNFKDLSEQIAVAFYSMFYVEEILTSQSIEQTEEIKKFFKIETLYSCVRKYGIDLDDMITEFTDTATTKVFYWQSQSIDYDIDMLNSTLTPEFISIHPSSNLNKFQEGVVVPLNSVGKLIFVIREIENISLIIEDALGNNVTDSFDSTYNVGLRAKVYLSKVPYINSNIFFKFKHIIHE